MSRDQPTDRDGRPNVVLITSHDLGQHLGSYGVDTVDTPNIDALADRGVQFGNAFTTTPVCSPSRGSLLTGRYPQSNGLIGLTHSPKWWRLDDAEETLPELLGKAGYETHLAGLQHVAQDPSRLEFDHRHSTEQDAKETAAAATSISEAADDGPFYAQFGFFEVHRPFERGTYREEGVHVPPYIEDTEGMREDFAAFQAEVNFLDERVGEILAALDANGRREDTVVVFAADHGIPYPGAKWWCRSPGVEIAMIMDGPGPTFEGHDTEESILSNVDVVPTLFDVLDLPIPDRVQGASFHDYLAGEADDPPREAAFTQYGGSDSRGIVTDRYNLIRNFGAGRTVDYPVEAPPTSRSPDLGPSADPLPYAQLYDRVTDPHELADIAEEREDVVEDLSERLLTRMAEIDDPLVRGPIPTPYYERAMTDFLTGGPGRE